MRASGILMPVFSLPGPFGIGTLGKEAFAFVDFLADAKQTYWQILPIGPTGYGDSPYQSFSAFAGNPYFIDYRVLAEDGWLTPDEVPAPVPVGTVDYGALYNERPAILKRAADRLLAEPSKAYTDFCAAQDFWLDDYALFMALKAEQGQAGLADWPDALRTREPSALAAARVRLADAVDYHKAVQFFFFTQWSALKTYANQKGIQLVGDIPIYVSPDSSDLWTRPELFQTDGQVHLTQVAGCPPDGFSATGQLWGNPLFDWDAMAANGYAWWVRRVRHALSIYDILRIDHFRGFDTYWAIPAGDENARGGKWEQGPGMDLFRALRTALGDLPIVAEDLGEIFDSVRVLLAESGFPGMKVLQFSLNGTDSLDLPHNYPAHCVAYPGTHDNNTLRGWLENETTPAQRKQAKAYFALTEQEGEITGLLRGVLASPAELAIVTMADWLEKGSEARMNTPGNPAGNWQWRVAAKDLTPALARKIHEMSARYFRAEPLPEAEPKKEKAPAPQPKAKAADAKEEKTTAPAKKAAKSAK